MGERGREEQAVVTMIGDGDEVLSDVRSWYREVYEYHNVKSVGRETSVRRFLLQFIELLTLYYRDLARQLDELLVKLWPSNRRTHVVRPI